MIPALTISPQSVLELVRKNGKSYQMSEQTEKLFAAERDRLPLHWDTREMRPDVRSLYFAKAGKKFNPALQILEMLEAGHLVVASMRDLRLAFSEQRILKILESLPLICIDNTNDLVHEASILALPSGREKIKSVGITGTNGKTSCTSIISELIREATGKPVARIGTLGFFDGYENFEHAFPTTPDFGTLCRCLKVILEKNVEYLIMEVSSHGLEENRLGDWKFDVAVLTNITPDHLDYHKNMENYRRAKIKLFTNHLKSETGQTIVCASRSPWNDVIRSSLHGKKCTILFDSNSKNEIEAFQRNMLRNKDLEEKLDAYTVTCLEENLEYIEFQLSGIKTAHSNKEIVKSPLIGRFQIENIGESILAAHAFGIPFSDLTRAAKKLSGVPGRLQRVQFQRDAQDTPHVFIDYAHSADSLEQALISLRALAKKQKDSFTKIILVFGCGGDRDRLKRPAMGRIASTLSDYTFVTSDNPRSENPANIAEDILKGVDEEKMNKVSVVLDREKAIEAALMHAQRNDIILIAGKGHESYQIVTNEKHHFSDYEVALKILKTVCCK